VDADGVNVEKTKRRHVNAKQTIHTWRKMPKTVPIRKIAEVLTEQRRQMLKLANTELTAHQTLLLSLAFGVNKELGEMFGVELPNLEALIKEHNEIVYLEQLYKLNPDHEEERSITIEEERKEGRLAGMDSPEIGGHETS